MEKQLILSLSYENLFCLSSGEEISVYGRPDCKSRIVLYKHFSPPRKEERDYITSLLSQTPKGLDWLSFSFLTGQATCNNKILSCKYL